MSNNVQNLRNMFKSCLNILRDNEHLTGDKALRNLAYFLVLRLIEPKIDEMGMMDYDYPFDEYDEEDRKKIMSCLKFSELINNKEDNYLFLLKPLWECVLSEHPKTKDIFSKDNFFNIKNLSTFTKLFKKLSNFDFSNIEVDIQGEAYEEVIKDVMTGKTLGQFFTPPLIKKFIVNKIKPNVLQDGKIETIFDPAMGTGGFLITALRYLMKESSEKSIPLNWNYISNKGINGREAEPDTYQLARANMLISTGYMFGKNLEKDDTIRNPIQNKYDIVITNPPFGIKGLNYDEIYSELRNEYLPIKTNSAVPLFLQAIIYMLKINGRCGVVLPDGQELFGKQKMLVSVREYLMKTCDLKEVVYIPSGVFTHTSIKTCLFFFEKKKKATEVLETKVSYSNKTNKETRRSYKFVKEHTTEKVDFTQFNVDTGETKLLVSVPVEKLAQNGYSLNFNEYLEVEEEKFYFDNIEVKTLREILKKRTDKIKLIDDIEYKVIGLSSEGYSKIKKYKFGKDIKMKNQQNTIVNTFVISKILNYCFGYITNDTENGILSSEYWIFDVIDGVNKKLFYYIYINYIKNQLEDISNGVGIPRINYEKFMKLKIPIPPLEIQKDIVEQLDFIYEQCIVESENKIQQLKKLNEMYLKNRIKYENNEKTLGEVCEFKNGKCLSRKKFIKGNFPVIGGGKIPSGYHNEYNREKNTILCSSSGAYAGYVSKYNTKVWASDCFSIISNENNCLNNYLYFFLKKNQENIYKLQTGTAQPHVYSNTISNIKIPIPPLEIQKDIVDYCDNNNNLIEKLKEEIERNKDLADKIINSICQKVEVVNNSETSNISKKSKKIKKIRIKKVKNTQ